MKFAFRIILLIFSVTTIISANETSIYYEFAYNNKSYKNPLIVKGYPWESLSSPMHTIGGYYIHEFNDNSLFGIGIVQTEITYASVKIENKLIEQPETLITLPYLFIGWQGIKWSLEIGISYYFDIEKFKEVKYVNGKIAKKSSWGLNRFKSHTFINSKLRLFEKNKIHFELLIGRGKFSPLDSLFSFNIVLPYKKFVFNTLISTKMPANYFSNNNNLLKSNEKVTLGMEYSDSKLKFGINIGFLVKNATEEGVKNYLRFDKRFSFGLNTGINF